MKCTQCVGLAAVALVVMVLLTGSARVEADEDCKITGATFEYNRKYRIGRHVKFRVSCTGSHFDALVGPLPRAGVGSYTVFEAIKDMTGADTIFNMEIRDQDGFVYMCGVQPYGGTDGGSAKGKGEGEGTSMIVQRITVDGTIYHRFFRLVAEDNVNVYDVDKPPKTVEITRNYRYIQRTNGELSGMIPIPTAQHDQIYQFVVDVLGLAAGAGMAVPGPPT